MGSIPLSGGVVSLALNEPFLFAATAGAGIHALDISTPAAPRLVYTLVRPVDVIVADAQLLLGLRVGAATPLRAWDIAQPDAPRELAVPPGIGASQFSNVALDGGLAVVAGGGAPLSVLDVSDLAAIRLVSQVSAAVNLAAVRLRDRRAYCSTEVAGDGRLGIVIYDLTDAKNPAQLATIRAPRADGLSRVRRPGHFDVIAEAIGSVLYTAAHGALSAVSLLDLNAPLTLATLQITPDAVHVARWGERLVVAGGDVDLIDVAVPAVPRPLTRLATPGTARGALIASGHLFIADGEAGPSVYRL